MPKSKDGKEEEIKMLPILVGVDHESNWITANMVPKKGPDPFAVHVVVKEIEASGYNKMIVKSDQEPAILDLLRTARRERGQKPSRLYPRRAQWESIKAMARLRTQFRSWRGRSEQ